MIDGLPVSLLDGVGVVGVVVFVGWLIMTGRWVPRRTYEDQVDRANQWMAECRIKDQQIALKDEQLSEKDKQLGHMAEVGRTTQAIMSAIQKRAGEVAP